VSQSNQFCRRNHLCCFSTGIYFCKRIFLCDSVRELLNKPSCVLVNRILTCLTIFIIEAPRLRMYLCFDVHISQPKCLMYIKIFVTVVIIDAVLIFIKQLICTLMTTHLHLVPRSKNEWSYTSTPQYAFLAWCSVKRNHRDTLIFYVPVKLV
jgi:hypothetical protein